MIFGGEYYEIISIFLSLLIAMLSIPASALTDEEWYQLRAERDEFYLEEWGVTEERFWVGEFGFGRMEKWGDFEVFVQNEGMLLLKYYGTEVDLVIPEGVTRFSDGIP